MEQSVSTVPVIENLQSSPTLAKLFEALAKAQGAMKPAVLDKVNPAFNSRYASLSSIMEAIREPLPANGLAISQQVFTTKDGFAVRTTLGHSSGEWISNTFKLILDKQNMQGLGSAITYSRRYGVSALVGVVDTEDDDGNAASVTNSKNPAGGAPRANAAASKAPAKEAGPAANQGAKIETPPKQAPANHAPATAEQQNEIINLAIERGIPEAELNLVITNGYAHLKGVTPFWIAKEIITELAKPETTSESFAQFGKLVKARREAAHLRSRPTFFFQSPTTGITEATPTNT